MNKTDYIDKMKSMWNDPTKFRKLTDVKNIEVKTEKLLTNSLNELKK